MTRPIFLLTDFGVRDHYAGQVRAVIASVAPASPIHDLTHEVEPFAIDEAAWFLETALPVLPADAVVLAVVDPGVGTSRRALAVSAEGRAFIGPDNGILSAVFPATARARLDAPAEARLPARSTEVRVLEHRGYRRDKVSATFHGRDIFAPAAARIAAGVNPEALGTCVDTAWLLPPFRGRREGSALHGYVIHVDRYGNLITTVHEEQLPPEFTVRLGGQVIERRVRTFAEASGQGIFCHVDSSGFLAVAANGRSAAADLGAGRGDPVAVLAT